MIKFFNPKKTLKNFNDRQKLCMYWRREWVIERKWRFLRQHRHFYSLRVIFWWLILCINLTSHGVTRLNIIYGCVCEGFVLFCFVFNEIMQVRPEQLPFHFPLLCIGEGNGNPLQCSCLENPRDRGIWWASVYGILQSQTRLTRLSSSSSSIWIGGFGILPSAM